jgi:hypothetical protein
MDHEIMRALRAQYSYPPGRLEVTAREEILAHDIGDRRLCVVVPNTAEWALPAVRARHSSLAVDCFHTDLLMANNEPDQLHGLLSCVTWGFISGTDLRIKPGRAFGKAGILLKGAGAAKPAQPRSMITDLLRTARAAAGEGDLAAAVRTCLQLKFIGPAFATKIVMMMRPDIAGVLDSVINERCLDHADPDLAAIHGRMEPPTTASATERFVTRYVQWCAWCARQAEALNTKESTWPDWDGKEHRWRAVDVERAFFAMGRDRTAAE